MEFAVIDLETTGFSPENGDRIIEIGIVFLDENLNEIRTYESLVNPQRRVRKSVHGISNEDLAGQRTFSELFDELLEQLQNTACLVAHHIVFEKRFLAAEFGCNEFCLPPELQEICTMKAAKSLNIGSNQKLGTLTEELGIEFQGSSHRALPDALATAELLRHLARSEFTLPRMCPLDWRQSVAETSVAPGLGSAKQRPPKKKVGNPRSRPANASISQEPRPVPAADIHTVSNAVSIKKKSKVEGSRSMAKADLSRPVQILINKLQSESKMAQNAADSLIDQARRHGAKLNDAVRFLSPFLRADSFELRITIAVALGNIGTKKAVNAIAKAFQECSHEELAVGCSYSCWSEEPLHYWFAGAIGEDENRMTASTLIALLSSSTLPDTAKASLMKKIGEFDIEELNVKFPEDIVETIECFASSDDPDIAEGAIKMLGQL